jgi:hypothetical protein
MMMGCERFIDHRVGSIADLARPLHNLVSLHACCEPCRRRKRAAELLALDSGATTPYNAAILTNERSCGR